MRAYIQYRSYALGAAVALLALAGCFPDEPVGPPACGDGLVQSPEVCDDGNDRDGDGCSADCRSLETCGNRIIDTAAGETCDDGNDQPGDGCSPICAWEYCGNGAVDPGEVCDDGNILAGDGCSPDCRSDETCGNDIIDVAAGEACDDHNPDSGDGCQADCALPSCGDGVVDAGEKCDDGNRDDGDGCNGTCTSDETCGNGVVDWTVGEECDDESVAGNGCAADCTLEYCGNGVLDPGEACDDHNRADGDGCSGDCGSDETCGNSVVDGAVGEECDDGGVASGDGCSAACRLEYCGNGVVDPNEVCDDGNGLSGDGCAGGCQSDETCGNGVVDVAAGEACDDHNRDSGDGCQADCALPSCGDGVVDAGEVCDDGNRYDGDGCNGTCTSDETCGNGVVDWPVGEECDDESVAGGDGCTADCKREYCGNGRVDAGEVCDDGNEERGDGCSGDCRSIEICGNGVVDAVKGEECDDGNLLDGDGCQAGCMLPVCGDGILDEGEVCDDGGVVDGDGCSADCRSDETCGNEVWDWRVGEGCDDGDVVSGDGCSAVCELEYCGNGTLDAGEACDDGNAVAGDGCSADCRSIEICGNGIVDGAVGEQCDDWGSVGGDGCSADCRLEYCGNWTVDAGEVCDDGNLVDGDGCSANCLAEPMVVAGLEHTCTLLETGAVRCWGSGGNGRLGYGNTNSIGDDETAASSGNVDVGGPVIQLAAGSHHTCALLASGTVRCWGSGGNGRLGYGNTNAIGDDETPASAGDVDVGGPVIQLAAGGAHTCALLANGAVRCWGWGLSGQLGYGNTNNIGDDETPASVGDVDVGGPVIQLDAGGLHTCALLASGAARCWGWGSDGRLGYGNTSNIGDNETPASAGDVDVGGPVIQLAAGGFHTCALLASGAVRCWGMNTYGQLGYGNTSNIGNNETPASAGDVDVGGPAIQLAAAYGHTCAMLASGAVRCWGDGSYGQLGYGNTSNIGDDEVPASAGDVDVGGPVIQLTGGLMHTCALLASRAMRCWGYGGVGQLGYGNTNSIGDDETPASAGDVPYL